MRQLLAGLRDDSTPHQPGFVLHMAHVSAAEVLPLLAEAKAEGARALLLSSCWCCWEKTQPAHLVQRIWCCRWRKATKKVLAPVLVVPSAQWCSQHAGSSVTAPKVRDEAPESHFQHTICRRPQGVRHSLQLMHAVQVMQPHEVQQYL